jgi:hypothetical protein
MAQYPRALLLDLGRQQPLAPVAEAIFRDTVAIAAPKPYSLYSPPDITIMGQTIRLRYYTACLCPFNGCTSPRQPLADDLEQKIE